MPTWADSCPGFGRVRIGHPLTSYRLLTYITRRPSAAPVNQPWVVPPVTMRDIRGASYQKESGINSTVLPDYPLRKCIIKRWPASASCSCNDFPFCPVDLVENADIDFQADFRGRFDHHVFDEVDTGDYESVWSACLESYNEVSPPDTFTSHFD